MNRGGSQKLTSKTYLATRRDPVVEDGSYGHVYGLDLVSRTEGAGDKSYFLGNGLGSTEKLTDGSGNVIASYKYDVYGTVRSSSGTG